jgi:hypothetical protein
MIGTTLYLIFIAGWVFTNKVAALYLIDGSGGSKASSLEGSLNLTLLSEVC